MRTDSYGILADGGLGREHDEVRAVDDRVGHVGDLGAGGAGALGHVFEHLRGGDDEFARGVALADDLLLNDGDFVDRDRHAHVAAGDHDPVGGVDDLVDVADRLAALDLGDDLAVGQVRLDDGRRFEDVGRVSHEGQADVIDLVLNPELDVLPVLLGHRLERQGAPGMLMPFRSLRMPPSMTVARMLPAWTLSARRASWPSSM